MPRMLAAAICTLTLLVASGIGATAAAPKPVAPCVTPTGVDLNARYGVSVAIIAPFCPVLESGRAWAASSAWTVGYTHAAIPDGYVSAAATPLDDFLAKFVAVDWVIDPGTAQEKSYAFTGTANLGVFPDDEIIIINTVPVGTAPPLSVGPHEIVVYFTLTAQHCDGLGAEAENCLPAGTSVLAQFAFEVVAGHHS